MAFEAIDVLETPAARAELERVGATQAPVTIAPGGAVEGWNPQALAALVGHITPEAQEGGPLGLLRNGDAITIDAANNTLSVALSEAELEARRAAWIQPPYKATQGVLYKYIRCVRPASEGCITDA